MSLTINPLMIPVAATVPILLGLLWFHPALGGRIWHRDETQPIFVHTFSVLQLLTFYLLSCLMAFALFGFVNHQLSIVQLFSGEPDFANVESDAHVAFDQVVALVGDRHLSFGHGAFHGLLGSIIFAIPILAHSSMRERRGFRPVLLYWIYWAASMTLMGGILGQWGLTIS